MATIPALIEGLKILQKYEPDADVYGIARSPFGSIEVQEQSFDRMASADHQALRALGWKPRGMCIWNL